MSEMEEILIKIKRTNTNNTLEIKITKGSTVSELKEVIQDKSGIEASRQTLVYKGRILSDDKTLIEYSVDNEHSLILVEKAVNTQTTSSSTSNQTGNPNPRPFTMQAGLGTPGVINTDLLRQPIGGSMDLNAAMNLMNNPQVQQSMNEMLSNPQILKAILENPSIKPMLDSNPLMRSMLSNPQFLQTMMNPTFLQSMSGIMNNSGTATPSTNQPNPNSTESGTSNTNNLSSNPFVNNNNLFQNFSGFPPFMNNNLGNLGNFSNPLLTNQSVDAKEMYKEQNIKLKEMGFINDEVNFEVLKKTGGNVDAAVERLLNMLN